jgi:heat shock protein HslJ
MTNVSEHRDPGRLRASRGSGSTDGSARAGRGKPALLSLVVWALAALGGCGGGGGTGANELPLRTDVEWQLERFQPNAGPSILVPDPSLYAVRFGADGTVEARADCNHCGGGCQVAGAVMTIGPLACTLAACPLPSLGDRFTAALTRVSSYVQTPSELVLAHDGGTLRFRAAQQGQ